ncbi:hypothetical protein N7462_005185 [Penicillium macrosclerotiorum]|uniref:uncharacterized protein n=1 Tax=Penicillium macrosclerotiorum TaxID=303699 RepID=UPI002548E0B3|nr:uncharacterized protein N7462_005185 [Penicillium macrosclerotiorum]KAJ5690793.1 hypothetical protein N7462_005185 [Penicillium macrosclerotiorum]
MTSMNTLGPNHLLGLAAHALRDGPPSLKTPFEAVALICHARMAVAGFKLVGLGEDHKIESPTENPALPIEWNANTTFAFRYTHTQTTSQYFLKVSRLGNKAVVFALAVDDDRTSSFELSVNDYISESALPLANTENLVGSLQDVYIDQEKLESLVGLFDTNILQNIAPRLSREDFEDPTQAPVSREPLQESRPHDPLRDPLRDDSLPQPARPYPFDDPLAAAPRQPNPPGDFAPPGFEDEFEINRPPRGQAPGFPGGRNPYTIGDRDLYPAGLGPNDPLRGSMGPGVGSGGGMHPTFDDPLFGGSGSSGGYDPRAPPGARYDPPGPGAPPFGRGHGPGSGGLGGFGGGFGGGII